MHDEAMLRAESGAGAAVQSLRAQLQRWATKRPPSARVGSDQTPTSRVISSGCGALDQLLPQAGFPDGSLVECLGDSVHAGGAGMLALVLARQAQAAGGALVAVDPRQWFYPPAAAALGVDLAALIVVRAQSYRDQIWALDQALRCPAVAAVWAPLEKIDEHDFRRLQLAVEEGGGLGLLVRCHHARGQPSWSDIQLWVDAQPAASDQLRRGRQLRIEVTRCRQGRSGGVVEVEIDEATGVMRQASSHHETPTLYPAAELAHSASGSRSARA